MTVLADVLVDSGAGIGGRRDRSYLIPSHVHVCITGDGSVMLDLKRDKYFGLGRKDTWLLATMVDDWPSPAWACTSAESPNPEAAKRICRSMFEEGLLVEVDTLASGRRLQQHSDACETDGVSSAGRGRLSIDMKAPLLSVGDEIEVPAAIRFRHVARFAAAYAWAFYSLRGRPLMATVAAVRVQKNQHLQSGARWELLRLAGLIDIFRRLRPYLFAAEGHCMVHALTLVRFLGSYDIYPDWVIGVATQPWAAHSWVQWGNYLLDTNPEKVCQYTPILVV
jgi:Transglutaminase-like superfamily